MYDFPHEGLGLDNRQTHLPSIYYLSLALAQVVYSFGTPSHQRNEVGSLHQPREVKGLLWACDNLRSEVISQVPMTTTYQFSSVMADSQQLPGSKRTRIAEGGVEEPDFSIPSGSTAVEAPSRIEQLEHSHAKR